MKGDNSIVKGVTGQLRRRLTGTERADRQRARLLAGVIMLIAAGSFQLESANAETGLNGVSEYSTPAGITLAQAVKEAGYMTAYGSGYQWSRIGDELGNTLYVYDGDVDTCSGECVKDFKPALAAQDAEASGDWSLVERSKGVKQWAYKGKPLYRFTRETSPNEVVENVLASTGHKDFLSATSSSDDLLPPQGWRIARLEPMADLETPGTIQVRELPLAIGRALVDHQGMTLYIANDQTQGNFETCEQDCQHHWQPLLTPELSNPRGLFTAEQREDGSRQWVFRGARLFTYSGDKHPGDTNGVNRYWRVATLVRHYMPAQVRIQKNSVHNHILATTEGMPLYSRSPFARKLERGVIYRRGRLVGTQFCDTECERSWKPLVAPVNAEPRGYWEILEREDGTRQWAYKGFAQYTYVHDKPNKVATGDNTYEYTIAGESRYAVDEVVATTTNKIYPLALLWEVTVP